MRLEMTAQALPLDRLWPIRDVLTFSFDLELRSQPASLCELGLSENHGTVFADDATAGLYATWIAGSDVYAVNIDSWGALRPLGSGALEAIAMVVALPYWRELVQLPRGSLDEWRTAAQRLEREVLEDITELCAARDGIADLVPWRELHDPLAQLYELNRVAQALPRLSRPPNAEAGIIVLSS